VTDTGAFFSYIYPLALPQRAYQCQKFIQESKSMSIVGNECGDPDRNLFRGFAVPHSIVADIQHGRMPNVSRPIVKQL
jgi:hypothetical protein